MSKHFVMVGSKNSLVRGTTLQQNQAQEGMVVGCDQFGEREEKSTQEDGTKHLLLQKEDSI